MNVFGADSGLFIGLFGRPKITGAFVWDFELLGKFRIKTRAIVCD